MNVRKLLTIINVLKKHFYWIFMVVTNFIKWYNGYDGVVVIEIEKKIGKMKREMKKKLLLVEKKLICGSIF